HPRRARTPGATLRRALPARSGLGSSDMMAREGAPVAFVIRLSPLTPVEVESARTANSVLPSPLWGGWRAKRAGWGACGRPLTDPRPQPLPSRLRACPLPANLKGTKPRQAGVWLGRGVHRVGGAIIKHDDRQKRRG